MSNTGKAKTEVTKAIEETLSQMIFRPEGELDPDDPNILQPYAERVLISRLQILKLLPKDPESLAKMDFDKLKASMPVTAILEGLLYQHEFEKALYNNAYSRLKACNLTWEQMLASEITDEEYLREIFVRLVEEKHGVEVTSWKQLQELTGLTEQYLEWDEATETATRVKRTKKAAQEVANEWLEETFLEAMKYRYRKFLESMLVSGGKYRDLLEVSPTEFHLPESLKEETIAWTIGLYFGMGDPEYATLSVRSVAEQIDAPYGVILSIMRGIKP